MFWDPLVGFQSIRILAKNPCLPPQSWQVAGHLALALAQGPLTWDSLLRSPKLAALGMVLAHRYVLFGLLSAYKCKTFI